MTVYTVHTVPGSPFARAVMVMLEEKGADWRIAPLAPGQHREPAHLAMQPFAKMPVLTWINDRGDGETLYETQAILRYLDEAVAGPLFTPTDVLRRARMNQLLGIADCYLFPDSARIIVFQRVVGPMIMGLEPDEAACAAAMPASQVIFGELSRLLGDAPWFGGPQPSLADWLLGAQLSWYRGLPEWIALTAARPNLPQWLDRIEARPSFATTALPALQQRIAAASTAPGFASA